MLTFSCGKTPIVNFKQMIHQLFPIFENIIAWPNTTSKPKDIPVGIPLVLVELIGVVCEDLALWCITEVPGMSVYISPVVVMINS